MQRTKPPFRADHVGSLLRPAALKEARAKREQRRDQRRRNSRRSRTARSRRSSRSRRRSGSIGHRRRIPPRLLELRFSRRARRRRSLSRRAQDQVPGAAAQADDAARHRQARRLPPHPMIEHFKFVPSHTKQTPKMTIPSPSSLHFRYGRDAVPESIYPVMDDFYRDLGESYRKAVRAFADAGCRYCSSTRSTSPICAIRSCASRSTTAATIRTSCRTLCGHDQCGDLRHARRHDHHDASVPRQFPVHLRRLRAATSRSPRSCSTRSTSTAYFMEYDTERAGGFEPLRFVPKGKIVVLGLVTSKTGTLESKDGIKRRIDEAAKFVALDQLCLRRNAASPRPRKAICWPRTSNGRSSG